jgi:hypothetical protein
VREPNSIADPIKPKGAGEIVDRMIIAPHELNDAITDDDVKALIVDVAKMRNVTVIVPSEKRADYWSDVAAQVLMSDNIASGVEILKGGKLIGITDSSRTSRHVRFVPITDLVISS